MPIRQHLVTSLQELDRSYAETIHSVNIFYHHFKSELLVIQHQLHSGEPVRRMSSASQNVSVDNSEGSVDVSGATTSVSVEPERTYANIVRSESTASAQTSQTTGTTPVKTSSARQSATLRTVTSDHTSATS